MNPAIEWLENSPASRYNLGKTDIVDRMPVNWAGQDMIMYRGKGAAGRGVHMQPFIDLKTCEHINGADTYWWRAEPLTDDEVQQELDDLADRS